MADGVRLHRMKTSDRLAAAAARGERLFRAPGRVNIIGEHTDYSAGFVLPTNTGLYTWVTATPRNDRRIRVHANNFDASESFDLDDIKPRGNPGWIDYVRGVAGELEQGGATLVGADLSIDGEIPIGGGLSSSASLELAVAAAMLGMSDRALPAPQIAALCQRAEQRYAAVNCGIMDQFSVICGEREQAMLLDCRTLETEFVRLPDDLALVVTDSGVKHALPDSGYNDRHDECRRAVRLLNEVEASIDTLRDASLELLEREKSRLGKPLFQRARHVVSEIGRVHEAFTALREQKLETLGELVRASHASLRDDYEVSCDEIESLIAITDGIDGVLGSRMIGGGFGGCVLSIAHTENVQNVIGQIRESYGRVLGEEPWVHAVTPADSAGEVTAA
jgi:galactokinase